MSKVKERACRTCHLITRKTICPQCKTHTLSTNYSGVIIILDSASSGLAEKMNISVPGKYALKVR